MAKQTITLAGKLKRFYGNFTEKTCVVFTLEGDPRIHQMTAGGNYDFNVLRLSAPGDEIRVEAQEEGWLLKEIVFSSWENLTLARELGKTSR